MLLQRHPHCPSKRLHNSTTSSTSRKPSSKHPTISATSTATQHNPSTTIPITTITTKHPSSTPTSGEYLYVVFVPVPFPLPPFQPNGDPNSGCPSVP